MSGPDDDATTTTTPVRAVERACAIMSAFSLEEPALTLGDLATRVELPKPTAYRIAASLVQSGFMSQSEDGRYALGTRLMELGAIVREHLDIVQMCAPVLQALAAETGETVLLGKPDWRDYEIVVVARRDSAHALSILSPVGRRSPLGLGSLGKALLSGVPAPDREALIAKLGLPDGRGALLDELQAAAARGFAAERDGYIDGVSGVAAPVLLDGSRPLAAIAVVGPSSRLGERLDDVGERLARAASAL